MPCRGRVGAARCKRWIATFLPQKVLDYHFPASGRILGRHVGFSWYGPCSKIRVRPCALAPYPLSAFERLDNVSEPRLARKLPYRPPAFSLAWYMVVLRLQTWIYGADGG